VFVVAYYELLTVRRAARAVGQTVRPDREGRTRRVDEDVNRTLIRVRADVIADGADRQSVAIERDRVAEVIPRRAVAGGEFLLLIPASVVSEDVGRTLLAARADVVVLRADHQGAASERDRVAEATFRRAVTGSELLCLNPGRAATREDVDRTLTGVRADGVENRAHRQRVATQ